MQQKRIKSNNEKKIELKPRRIISFKTITEEYDEIPFEYNGKLLFVLTTKFNISDYGAIFEKYKEKKFPILLQNENFVFDEQTQDVLRDLSDEETKKYNSYINKVRTIQLLKLCTEYLDIPENTDEAIEILSELGHDIFEKINEKLQEIITHKQTKLKERKHDMCREALAFSIEEKAYINEQRRLMSLPISNKKGEPHDGRKCDIGITQEYIYLSLAEKYNWTMDYLIKVFKGDVSEEEAVIIDMMCAKYELDQESETRLHKELEESRKNN